MIEKYWPNSVVEDIDLKWLIENQASIVKAWPARKMFKSRPILKFPSGKVRIEFVGTFSSAKEARLICESKLKRV